MKKSSVPKYNELIMPTFVALKNLGGSGRNSEILEQVMSYMGLDDSIMDIPHKSKYASYQSELEYRLAWARTYLAKSGYIARHSRAVWAICPEYSNLSMLTDEQVAQIVRNGHISKSINDNYNNPEDNDKTNDEIEFPDEDKPWKDKLIATLLGMQPAAFERFSQLFLRECGFNKVTVTKATRDGGIDGKGELKINDIVSISMAFQCKRYKGAVPVSDIRDFRGSLTNDIEKAVFITTGYYTKSAKDEASVVGKMRIDLIDGAELVEKIAALNLGIKEVKTYQIDEEFFKTI